jgi:hypothetical protein
MKLPLVIENCPQIDRSRRVLSQLQGLLVQGGRFVQLSLLFPAHAFEKQRIGPILALGCRAGIVAQRGQPQPACFEIEFELARHGIHGGARVAKDQPRPARRQTRFQQRVGHAGNRAHGAHAGANAGRGDANRTQIAEFS